MSKQGWFSEAPQELIAQLNEEFDCQYSECWAAYSRRLMEHGYPQGDHIAKAQALLMREPAAELPLPAELCIPSELVGPHCFGYQRTMELRYHAGRRHLLESFLAGESCRFVRGAQFMGDAESSRLVETLAQSPHGLPWLEELTLNLCRRCDGEPSLSEMLAKMPRLKSLSLINSPSLTNSPTGSLDNPTIVTLEIDAGHVSDLPNMTLPSLRTLNLDVGARPTGRWFETILDAKGLENVCRMSLQYLATDELCAYLAGSEIAGQLEHLDLSNGWMRDEGAAALAASNGFAKLQHLDVRGNLITKAGVKSLDRLAKKVKGGSQWLATEHHYGPGSMLGDHPHR